MSATGINMSLDEATRISGEWVEKLKPFCERVEATGTVRRKDQETTHDIDLVLIRDESKQKKFAEIIDSLEYVKGKPDGKWCCRRLESGVMLDIRMCTEEDWGWRLIQHTGPTDFYLWARTQLLGEKNFRSEEEVFETLGMDFVAPENRHKIEVDMSTIQNKDVQLFGVVGIEDNTLKNIVEQMKDEDEINLQINSPGGDAVEGLAIFDFLKAADLPVSVDIFGEAASAAAIVSQGADKGKRRIAKNATFMIHNPFTLAAGEADDLEKTADKLRDFENRAIKLFSESTGQTQKKIRQLMDNGGTSMNAQEAKELGFIDEIIGAQNMAPIVWNMADLPEEIAKQLPVLRKTPPNKSFRWQDANANTFQLPEIGLFDLRINDKTFILTKEKFLMLQQFVSLSGCDKPEDALAYFSKLKENGGTAVLHVSTDGGTEVIEFNRQLESKVNTLQKDLVVKDSLLKSVVKNQAKQELEGRKTRLTACSDEFRIDVKQLSKAVLAYVDIDPDEVKNSQTGFEATIEFMESSQPREDLKSLTELSGSGGKGQVLERVEDQINAIAEAKQKEKPEMTFKEAFQLAKDEHPELLKKMSEVK